MQKHIIKKQVIELQIPESLDRNNIQNSISRIYRNEIIPMLDKLLTTKSGSGTLVIDRLEINIGFIPRKKIEQLLTQKIKAALQEQLDKLPKPASHPATTQLYKVQQEHHSDAELVLYFLQNGLFPWWAKETTNHYLKTTFRAVLAEQEKGFVRQLVTLVQENEEAINRLIYSFDDDVLLMITAQLTSIRPADLSAQKQLVFTLFSGLVNNNQLRMFWWTSWYKALASVTNGSKNVLVAKAGEWFMDEAMQKSSVAALLFSSKEDETNQLSKRIENLSHDFFINGIQRQLQDKMLNKAEQIVAALPEKTDIPIAFKQEEKKESLSKSAMEKETAFAGSETAKADDSLNRVKHRPDTKDNRSYKTIRTPSPDIDKVYIQNAGLVLLWPFLHRFFQNMSLANEKTLTGETSVERACLLLQYLATGTVEDMLEAQLPLNKLICGISLLQPVNMQWTISEEEKEIANNFLLAIIRNGGTGWKNLTVQGLQQAYLSREGIISSRDGNWLLQVKRETYDVLVDRLPWTIQVVKLPWMQHLMFVEWQLL